MRQAATRAVLCAALCLFVLSAASAQARASTHGWDGGHVAQGWSAASGTAYFAEGTTRNGFEEWLLLRNPGADPTTVSVAYSFPDRGTRRQQLKLEPWSGASVCVNEAVGADRDVSVSIRSTPGIIAERQIYFNYKCAWTGGTVVRGVESPKAEWFFAEGTTRRGFQEWLCIQNPGKNEVEATVTYMLATGENREQKVRLPASSRQTVDVNAAVGPGQDVSARVAADAPIVVERPMYFDYKGAWRGGHTSTGSAGLAGEWHFAEGTTREGFEEWLCVMNPGGRGNATVEYLIEGSDPVVRRYDLEARSRATISVNEAVGPGKDVSLKVTSDNDILCERPMYFKYHGAWEGGHDVVGAQEGERTWFFPTACTGANFASWMCVSNPGKKPNDVLLEVFGEGGGYESDEVELGPRSRATFDVSALAANVRNPWLKVSGTRELIAERPVYFSYSAKVEPRTFAVATWGDTEILSPIRYDECLGPQFHEAAPGDGSPAMQPVGICLANDNPGRFAPGVTTGVGSDPFYFVEDTRGRGTYATTACDVQAKAGATVYAPVGGTVVAAESYLLYRQYPDFRVKIRIDGHPEYQMFVLHLERLLTTTGARVEAGKTPIGVVRDLVPYFNSGPNPYTRDDGNHAHLQINYVPSQATGAAPPDPYGIE